MAKLYAACLVLVLLLCSRMGQAQRITLINNSSTLCIGAPFSISFATSGTFEPGNTFRVQLSNDYASTFIDVPGSFTSSPASFTLPLLAGSPFYQYRIVASNPLVYSNNSNLFRVSELPSALLKGSVIASSLQDPYTPTELLVQLSGRGSSVITLQNGLQFTRDNGYETSYEQRLPVAPAQTTTYSLASVQNSCGSGPVSGTTTVRVNAVGLRLVERGNESFCLGGQLPVYLSTTGPLPANTQFEAELISTTENNRSVILPVVGNTSPLLITLPKQYLGTSASGYKMRIYTKDGTLSAWLREGLTFTLVAPPRLSLATTNANVSPGGQTSLVLSYTTATPGDIMLSNGQVLNTFGGTATIAANVALTATTAYSIVSYAGACSELVTYGNRSMTVAVRPGIRIDSLSATEVCGGQPVTAYFTATPGYALPARLRVQYGSSFSVDAQVAKAGQLVFTAPEASTALPNQAFQLRDGLVDTLLVQTTLSLLVKGKPQAYLATRQVTLVNPGPYSLGLYLTANTTSTVLLNTGDRLTLTSGTGSGYYNFATPSVYVSRSTTYSVVSVSNECGTAVGQVGSTTITVQNLPPPQPIISVTKAEQDQTNSCPGGQQWLDVQPTGTFNADNQFQVELAAPSGLYTNPPLQTFTTTPVTSFTLPTTPGTYRVRVSSTSPVVRSNELSFYVPSLPTVTVTVSVALPGASYVKSLTAVPNQPVSVLYTFQGGRGPFRYALANGTQGQSLNGVSTTYQPAVTTSFGLERVTDACGFTATLAAGGTATVTVAPLVIWTGYANTTQACIQTPLLVPFVQSGSAPTTGPGSVSYAVQLSEDRNTWQTIPTSGTASPLVATLPESLAGKQVYYRVVALTGNGLTAGVPYVGRLTLLSTPRVTLSTPTGATSVSVDRGTYTPLMYTPLLVTDAYAVSMQGTQGNAVILSNGTYFEYVYAKVGGQVAYVSQPGTYSVIGVPNTCGFGTVQGNVRVIANPYVAQATTNGTAFCVGQRVDLSYALGGEFNADNKLAIYLVGSGRTLIAETTALSGVQSFTVGTGTTPGQYGIEIETSSPRSTLTAILTNALYFSAPASITLASGKRVLYQNDVLNLPLSPSLRQPYSFTLAAPGGQFLALVNNYVSFVSVTVTQSGSYSLTAVANECGAGQATGVYSVTVIPAASVTIRPDLNATPQCTGKSYVVNLTTTGTFDGTNTFTAYLSDSTGGNVRTLPSVSRGSQLTITVPNDLPKGDAYTLRVGSSSPQHLGASLAQNVRIRPSPTGLLTGNTSIQKGDSTRLSVILTGTPPWQLTITDIFGPRVFTASTSPFALTVKPDTTSGFRLVEVRDSQCGLGTVSGTALITVTKLLATEPTLPLQVRAYPNPTTSWLLIEGDLANQGEVRFDVHTTLGVLVQQSVGGVRQGKLEHRIDLSGQPGGVYILSAEQGGRRSRFMVVKQ